LLQTPGATCGVWSILDALLSPTGVGTPFIFRESLGQAREAKVALSGLFRRFVARAYLERYFDLSIFAHLGNRVVDLDRRKQARIKRLARGDLPDAAPNRPAKNSIDEYVCLRIQWLRPGSGSFWGCSLIPMRVGNHLP